MLPVPHTEPKKYSAQELIGCGGHVLVVRTIIFMTTMSDRIRITFAAGFQLDVFMDEARQEDFLERFEKVLKEQSQ